MCKSLGARDVEEGALLTVNIFTAFHPTQDPISSENISHALGSGGKSGSATAAVATSTAVRRLTPTECERLQGFPDDYTAIPYRRKAADQCPDGPRYKALGNSMAVPVMQWIGKRIMVIG
jgi:DNA (cytosine-5)-methyltransferase 1